MFCYGFQGNVKIKSRLFSHKECAIEKLRYCKCLDKILLAINASISQKKQAAKAGWNVNGSVLSGSVCVALMDVHGLCSSKEMLAVMSHEEISAGAISARSVLELYVMLTG